MADIEVDYINEDEQFRTMIVNSDITDFTQVATAVLQSNSECRRIRRYRLADKSGEWILPVGQMPVIPVDKTKKKVKRK